MENSFDILLKKLGIARKFTDAAQNQKEYVADDETLRKMVNYLGFELKNINDSEKLLQKLEKQRWLNVFEPIYVVQEKDKTIDIVLPQDQAQDYVLRVSEQGKSKFNQLKFEIKNEEKRTLGKINYVRQMLEISENLAPQYYDLELETAGKKYRSVLAITPEKCYTPKVLEKQKIWGFASQLYSLRSKQNWGVGDFSDLKKLVEICAQNGADIIGLNPLNVLVHDFPDDASPYSSISRLFLNPIYIDVKKVVGFEPEMLRGEENVLEGARSASDIDYSAVYNLKMRVLHKIFAKISGTKQEKEFMAYCTQKGDDLQSLATYQAIYSEYHNKVFGGWKSWPKELQNPRSKAVKEFALSHEKEVAFFKYLQFLCEKQLNEVYEFICEKGLKIGLYRDLPVGLSKDSLELWQDEDLFIKDCGAGAPPDAFFPSGQRWCLGAFNPFQLKSRAYQPFIKVLREAMRFAGSLRIDHVMSLMRLYIIPDKGENGTYVYYDFDDMLGIVALESYLNKCMIVGESIGNVPDGFIEKLHERGIYSLSVLWAERWESGQGLFKMPEDYPENVVCSIGTHDMAPLKARWFGYDIQALYDLKMLSEEEKNEQYKAREIERKYLLAALDYAKVWPADEQRKADYLYGEGYPEGIMPATEKYMSRSASKVYLAQAADIFGVDKMQNLPGTDHDKHPNWRRRLPVDLEDFSAHPEFIKAIKAIKEER